MRLSTFGLVSAFSTLVLAAGLPHATQAQAPTPIGTIQGAGATAAGGTYTVAGIVTAVYAGLSPAGFYLQNEAATADNDPATSDALFVVQAAPTVRPGDRVQVTGLVQENGVTPSFNQAVITNPSVVVQATGQAAPAFTILPNSTFSASSAEAAEGMLVQFSAPLTVTSVENLRGRGELTISVDGLVYQPTQLTDPNDSPASGTSSAGTSNVAAVTAFVAANAAKTLLLDDGRAASNPQPTPYLDPVLGTVRVGSTIPSLRGILAYGNNRWRVQPLPGPDAPALLVTRPPLPTFNAPLDVKLASFNVLNYFNGDGAGGGFPTSRGASSPADFARQRAKIIATLVQLNADVVGLIEMENDGTGPGSALLDLLAGLNQELGAGTYAFVDDGAGAQPYNSDLIRCAIIYKPAAVQPVGSVLLSPNFVFERPPVAQLFRTLTARAAPTAGSTFAFIVNHFKSKASGSGVNADKNDGQGRSNDRRKQQAAALAAFITDAVVPAGTPDVVSVGDYNAYYEEDPMDILRAAGLLIPGAPTSSSYVFSGLSGSLDHAVFTAGLARHAEVHPWNINAPEPEFLQYDVAGAATDLRSPFRSSDHDPLLIGLNFNQVLAAAPPRAGRQPAVFPNPASGGAGFEVRNLPAGACTVEVLSAQGARVLMLHGAGADLQGQVRLRTAQLAPGLYLLRLRGADYQHTLRVVRQ